MREYETIYILKPDLPGEQISKVKEKVENTIKKGKGHLISHSDWGKRKLAYPVEKFRHAQYFYFQYLDMGPSVSELERILKYDDTVLKFLTVKLKEKVNVEERLAKHEEAPLPPEEISSSRSTDFVKPRKEASGSEEENEKDFSEESPEDEIEEEETESPDTDANSEEK